MKNRRPQVDLYFCWCMNWLKQWVEMWKTWVKWGQQKCVKNRIKSWVCVAQLVDRLVLSHAVRQWQGRSWTQSPSMLVHKCKYMDEMVQLPCWSPTGQQVSHQRRNWGIRLCASKKIHKGRNTHWPGNSGQKSKIGISVAPQKRLMSPQKNLNKKRKNKCTERTMSTTPVER